MEAVRIIKEMRDANRRELQLSGSDVDIRLLRPRFAIWENVPGAFSSNNGEDFRVVLEELAHIIDKDAAIPKPEEKWKPSGLIIGDNWSVAWRTMDAQYWGVPQRRKRIALVLDCAGECAGEILFESESVSGDTEPSIEAWQGVAKCPSGSVGECGIESNTLKIRGGAK